MEIPKPQIHAPCQILITEKFTTFSNIIRNKD